MTSFVGILRERRLYMLLFAGAGLLWGLRFLEIGTWTGVQQGGGSGREFGDSQAEPSVEPVVASGDQPLNRDGALKSDSEPSQVEEAEGIEGSGEKMDDLGSKMFSGRVALGVGPTDVKEDVDGTVIIRARGAGSFEVAVTSGRWALAVERTVKRLSPIAGILDANPVWFPGAEDVTEGGTESVVWVGRTLHQKKLSVLDALTSEPLPSVSVYPALRGGSTWDMTREPVLWEGSSPVRVDPEWRGGSNRANIPLIIEVKDRGWVRHVVNCATPDPEILLFGQAGKLKCYVEPLKVAESDAEVRLWRDGERLDGKQPLLARPVSSEGVDFGYLAVGSYEVVVQQGVWYREPRIFGSVKVVVDQGREQTVIVPCSTEEFPKGSVRGGFLLHEDWDIERVRFEWRLVESFQSSSSGEGVVDLMVSELKRSDAGRYLFEIGEVDPGLYCMTFYPGSIGWSVDVAPGQDAVLDFTVSRPRRVEVTVLDSRSEDILRDCQLNWRCDCDPPRPYYFFTLPAPQVEAGVYRILAPCDQLILQAAHSQLGFVEERVSLDSLQQTYEVSLSLPKRD